MVDAIKDVIQGALPNAEIYVLDPQNDGQHFHAIVISEDFEGLSLVKQHQLVMKPLRVAFETTVHALGLKTFTPAAWADKKNDYLEVIS